MNNGLIRTDNYSVLKLLTTFLVIIAHATRMYTGYGAILMPPDAPLTVFTEVIYSFHMPLFIFLSGVVYGKCIQAGKYASYPKFIRTKVKRLLVPYLVFGVLYVAPVVVLLKITERSYFSYVLSGILLQGDSRHLWFLPVLFLFFVVTGLLKPLLQKNRVVPVALFAAALAASFFSGYFPTQLSASLCVKYYCYFLFGFILSNCPAAEEALFKNRLLLAGTTLAFAALSVVKFTLFSHPVMDTLLAFTGILMSLCWGGLVAPRFAGTRFYRAVQPTTMGIYLFHPMIIYVCFYAVKDAGLNPYLITAAVILFSFALSYLLTLLVKKLRGGFLLGE